MTFDETTDADVVVVVAIVAVVVVVVEGLLRMLLVSSYN